MDRRTLLLGLLATTPLASVLLTAPVLAQAANPIFTVSRMIVGHDNLDPSVSARIEAELARRDPNFRQNLEALAKALAGKDRDSALSGLDDRLSKTALSIAAPWYVGFIGSPSPLVLDDDAVFVTYFQAQAYEKVIDVVPRPAFSRGAPGWWAEPPKGVVPPAMPANIRDWNFQPANLAATIVDADPVYLALVSGVAENLEDAERQTRSGDNPGTRP